MRLTTTAVVGAMAIGLLVGCGDNLEPRPTELLVDPGSTLQVTEAGGRATFTVALSRRPRTEVTVAVASSDVSEGTVSPSTVTFSPLNFDTPVTVTVTGVDDLTADGDQSFAIALDAGDTARGFEVDVTNADNDSVGITVAPTDRTMTHEKNGTTAAFTIVLDTEPTGDVTIPLATADDSEGTVDTATVVFTPDNWNAPVAVAVSGVDDALADGPQEFAIAVGAATSTDTTYNGIDADDPTFVNIDDDSPGITVTPSAPMTTTERGTTATFAVVLTAQPTANVVLDLSSSDEGEGRVSSAQLTFTPLDWNALQTVTVTGVDDAFNDDDQSFTIVLAELSSTDLGYDGIDPPDVAVLNVDDEAPGFTITPLTGLATTEAGGSASFTIVLISQPTADVVVPFATSDATEGSPVQSSVTFTPMDWDIPKTITVTGANDDVADGNQPYKIEVRLVASVDPAYDALDPPDVSLTNIDNDTPGFTVTPTSGLLVSELGDSDVFDIVLNSEPTADVTITLVSNDTSEGRIMPASVTFTPASWDTPQRITVTGQDDQIADGNQAFTIVTNAATSMDPRYNGLNPANVQVTNFDDDGAQVVIDSPPLLQVSEDGTTATFTIVLTRRPTANVSCSFTSQNVGEGTVAPTPVIFTPGNFDQPRTVTLTGVDDTVDDGDQLFVVFTNPCSSADPQYANANPRDVPARNADND